MKLWSLLFTAWAATLIPADAAQAHGGGHGHREHHHAYHDHHHKHHGHPSHGKKKVKVVEHHHYYHYRPPERETVWIERPVVEPPRSRPSYRESAQTCWYEQVPVATYDSYTGTIIGGIVGGALGNELGHNKSNKQVGAAVGALLGGSIGRDLTIGQEGHTSAPRYREELRCSPR